jgi:hypothetical protein
MFLLLCPHAAHWASKPHATNKLLGFPFAFDETGDAALLKRQEDVPVSGPADDAL